MSWKALAIMIAGASVTLLAVAAMRTPDTESLIRQGVIGITARCEDGMYTTSDRDNGTCAWHGGVDQWFTQEE